MERAGVPVFPGTREPVTDVIWALSEIMRGSQVPLRDAVLADAQGHGHARKGGRRVIRGNGPLSLIDQAPLCV